jgi:hypothetical protein
MRPGLFSECELRSSENRPRVVPTKAGTQNPHYISPFAKGETKRGSRIQARIRELGRNDGSVTEWR